VGKHPKEERKPMAENAVSIEVKGLTKLYGDVRALVDVDFTVHAGEIVGLLGPNGAGKTTTMKILTGFIGATRGTAKVCGLDVAENSLAVRRQVGYLPETVPLYEDMVVYDYLAFVANMRQVPRGEVHTRIKEIADVCGLTHMANRYIREISKGYKQRVGLAQALIHRPEVVILDEPTSGLDPNQIVEIRDLIKEIGKEKTIIFSTHILQEIAAVCDRIIVIDEGVVVADGTVADLDKLVRVEERYTVTLSSSGGADTETEEKLRALGGVRVVENLSSAGAELVYLITADPGVDIRHDIFGLATDSGMALLGLERARLTLEDIFRSLTGDVDKLREDLRGRAALTGSVDSTQEVPA
jgi:ABC-2 type transport system ATP-binding protein